MARRTTTKATDRGVITSQEEFIATLDRIARLGVRLDMLQAAKETAMQQVLTEHDPEINDVVRYPRGNICVTHVQIHRDALNDRPHGVPYSGAPVSKNRLSDNKSMARENL